MAKALDDPATGRPRSKAIYEMTEGDTISVSRRLPIDYGVNSLEYDAAVANLRGLLDSQVARARRKFPGRTYVVENIAGISSRGNAIILTAAATRLE